MMRKNQYHSMPRALGSLPKTKKNILLCTTAFLRGTTIQLSLENRYDQKKKIAEK
jgi:hypothetical protein